MTAFQEEPAESAEQSNSPSAIVARSLSDDAAIPLAEWGNIVRSSIAQKLSKKNRKAFEMGFEAAATLQLVDSELASLAEQLQANLFELDQAEEYLDEHCSWDTSRRYWLAWADWTRAKARENLLASYMEATSSVRQLLRAAQQLERAEKYDEATELLAQVQLSNSQPCVAYRGLVGYYQVEQLEDMLRMPWFNGVERQVQEQLVSFLSLRSDAERQRLMELLNSFSAVQLSAKQSEALQTLMQK